MPSTRTYDHVLSEEFDDYDDRRRCCRCSPHPEDCRQASGIYSAALLLVCLGIGLAVGTALVFGLYRYWYCLTETAAPEPAQEVRGAGGGGGCWLCSVVKKMKFPVLWATAKLRSYVFGAYRFSNSAKSPPGWWKINVPCTARRRPVRGVTRQFPDSRTFSWFSFPFLIFIFLILRRLARPLTGESQFAIIFQRRKWKINTSRFWRVASRSARCCAADTAHFYTNFSTRNLLQTHRIKIVVRKKKTKILN